MIEPLQIIPTNQPELGQVLGSKVNELCREVNRLMTEPNDPTDTEMVDWIIRNKADVDFSRACGWIVYTEAFTPIPEDGVERWDWRESVRAAMKVKP